MMRISGLRYQGSSLVSHQRFRWLKLLFTLYTLAWISVLVYVNAASWITPVWRVGITLLLAVVAPTVHDLVESYSSYKKQWEADNAAAPGRSE